MSICAYMLICGYVCMDGWMHACMGAEAIQDPKKKVPGLGWNNGTKSDRLAEPKYPTF